MTQSQTDAEILASDQSGAEDMIIAENVEKWYDNSFHVLRG